MESYRYVVYILTNNRKNVLYTGVTSNFIQRLMEHKNGTKGWFTKKYQCHYLVYYEYHQYIISAIDREKEIKGWGREKKEKLINDFNPEWKFLNERIEDSKSSL
jgi:putative endonuclease